MGHPPWLFVWKKKYVFMFAYTMSLQTWLQHMTHSPQIKSHEQHARFRHQLFTLTLVLNVLRYPHHWYAQRVASNQNGDLILWCYKVWKSLIIASISKPTEIKTLPILQCTTLTLWCLLQNYTFLRDTWTCSRCVCWMNIHVPQYHKIHLLFKTVL
jgi:hypothetical protein